MQPSNDLDAFWLRYLVLIWLPRLIKGLFTYNIGTQLLGHFSGGQECSHREAFFLMVHYPPPLPGSQYGVLFFP